MTIHHIINRRILRITVAALCVCVMLLGALGAPAHAAYQPPRALVRLWELNHDVLAGLFIPGTSVCYPIMQHPIDDYYLNICFDGAEGYPGSIYTNMVEGQTFDTFNTVIYGHNMRDGSYFGSLKEFLDPDYLAWHRQIEIYGVDAKHVYDIFAVVIYNDKRISDWFPDEKPASRQAFLDSLRTEGLEGSIILNDVPVSIDSHLVTLSTCISGMHDNRLLIVAVERE